METILETTAKVKKKKPMSQMTTGAFVSY